MELENMKMTDATTTPTDKAGEPVAWLSTDEFGVQSTTANMDAMLDWRRYGRTITPLYTHPQPSLSVGLDRDVRERLEKALASIDRIFPVHVTETPDYAELGFNECRTQAMTVEPDTWTALNTLGDDLRSLLALAAPAEGYVLVSVEKLEDIVALSGFLRQGGCDAEDLAGLEYAVEAAVDLAAACLPAAPTGGRS